MTPDKYELDPVAQILMRRTMQVRRVAAKCHANIARYKKLILKYAEREKMGMSGQHGSIQMKPMQAVLPHILGRSHTPLRRTLMFSGRAIWRPKGPLGS